MVATKSPAGHTVTQPAISATKELAVHRNDCRCLPRRAPLAIANLDHLAPPDLANALVLGPVAVECRKLVVEVMAHGIVDTI